MTRLPSPQDSSTRHVAPPAASLRARIAWRVQRATGWSTILARPVPARCVVVFFPHTSNWDFVVGLLAKWAIGIEVRWIAKDSLFGTPLAPLLRRWGGIPVNRRQRSGMVGRLCDEFAAHDRFRVVIAPEGTRSRTRGWKSGFYRLALAAHVPLGLAYIDYRRREVGIGAWIRLTGDEAADMAAIAGFYRDKAARRPDCVGPIRLDDAGTQRQNGRAAP
ncbi:MAG TPA: 1-acyl-sn-glycerol-3-phosphate acyltransferase [Casimicrobiaceae bacterium]|nr:1-acyl-sn-glycerol-3-phosphate acyltransferase [Casimicrobiaceae bacterium]